MATSLNNLAVLYHAQGKYGRRSRSISGPWPFVKSPGPEHPDVATSLNNLAALYQAQGKYGEAEPLYQRALAIYEKALGPEHPNVATASTTWQCSTRPREYGEAEPLYKRSLAILKKALGPEHPDMATCLENYAALLKQWGGARKRNPWRPG